jgi:hypothetical protein
VRDEQGVGAGFGGSIHKLAHRAACLCVRPGWIGHRGRCAGAAVGQSIHALDLLSSEQLAGFDSPIEPARINLADRNAQLLDRRSNLARGRPAIVV